MGEMACPNGHPDPDGNTFCGSCSVPLPAVETPPAPALIPPAPCEDKAKRRETRGLVLAGVVLVAAIGAFVWWEGRG